MAMSPLVRGLHHITLITRNYAVNRWFYTKIMGMHVVKYSVNQDDPLHRHVFYSPPGAELGGAITFFEYTDAQEARPGIGVHHHLAYRVRSVDDLARIASWLKYNGVPFKGPVEYAGRVSIYFRDPDGSRLEICARASGKMLADYLTEEIEKMDNIDSSERAPILGPFDHASPLTGDPVLVERFAEKVLGLRPVFKDRSPGGALIVGLGLGEDAFLHYLYLPRARPGIMGYGGIHHIALTAEPEMQVEVMRRLDRMGWSNSGLVDRVWFRSLYFRDPEGNLLEVATPGPGYGVDEPAGKGQRLVLPSWLEPYRKQIEEYLKIIDSSNVPVLPPKYPEHADAPESV
ncbi:MAG: VOC family protein [Desulfurococcales archaeon]|nr:VOC family protein [Desulfurococcales archaeon]